jgi:hypothetical protein
VLGWFVSGTPTPGTAPLVILSAPGDGLVEDVGSGEWGDMGVAGDTNC